MSVRIEFTLPDDTYRRLEDARGQMPRAAFIKRALESALAGSGALVEVAPVSAQPPSAASTRSPAAVARKIRTEIEQHEGRRLSPEDRKAVESTIAEIVQKRQCLDCGAIGTHQRGCKRA